MNWNAYIEERLFSMQDIAYRDFQAKLIPNVDKESVIGVRTPDLRKFAKELAKMPGIEAFLQDLPHKYFEENNLHAFLLEGIKDYEKCIAYIEAFLPYVDNWATCDQMSPRVLGKHKEELYVKILEWTASQDTYKIRFGIGLLMRFYLEEGSFQEAHLQLAAGIKSEEYYVNMMIAWYFATALAKQYEATIPYLEKRVLSPWIHKKTIQKAVESYRITAEQKVYLKSLK